MISVSKKTILKTTEKQYFSDFKTIQEACDSKKLSKQLTLSGIICYILPTHDEKYLICGSRGSILVWDMVQMKLKSVIYVSDSMNSKYQRFKLIYSGGCRDGHLQQGLSPCDNLR